MTNARMALGLSLLVLVLAVTGSAQSMTANWYTVSLSDPDFGTVTQVSTYTNQVLTALGPHGWPVYNPSYGGSQVITDLLSSNEITWWSPASNSHVTATATTTVTLPYSNLGMFVPNGTGHNDSSAFQAAAFTGTLNVPSPE